MELKVGLKDKDDVPGLRRDYAGGPSRKVPGALSWASPSEDGTPGLELVVLGMSKDPQFGPVSCLVWRNPRRGSQGCRFRIVPLTREDARSMIREIKAYRLFEGYRGQPPIDVQYLESCCSRYRE